MTPAPEPAKHKDPCTVEGILKLLFAGAVTWAFFLFVAAWLFKDNMVIQVTMGNGMAGFLAALGVKMQPGATQPKPDTKSVTIENTDTTGVRQ